MLKENSSILVVDDTKTNIDILVELLDDYEVSVATNGLDAIEIVKNQKIDLILLDVMMPDLDGYEVCSILKEKEETASIPIIFVTAKTDENSIEKAYEIGAVDYVTKPFKPKELQAKIKLHLDFSDYQHSLEDRVKEETNKNRLKDQVLYQQSKQALLGELIMHIAHQWKQPLSEMSSINTVNIAKNSMGKTIETKELDEIFFKYEEIINFMSETIDTFQNFYKPSLKKRNFSVYDAVVKAYKIVDATFDFNDIKIEINLEKDKEIFANENEFAQVILNVLNNSKDIFKNREIKNPKVSIKIDVEDNKSKILICDNAGGIKEEIIDKLFLPFISGKSSTGLGLYMSKNILEKNGGDISAFNSENGACFKIEI